MFHIQKTRHEYRNLTGKLLGRLRMWIDNIKINLRELLCEHMNWLRVMSNGSDVEPSGSATEG